MNFLDTKHGENWSIWEFRAEGTGYPDSEVYERIHHFPWPDHHPPPFALIPAIMATMRNWLQGEGGRDNSLGLNRVAVVHCKAGKGRSGTVACSYMISQEGWRMEDALQRFTKRRMRVGFGNGVSLSSQVRWVGYVNRWTNQMRKVYIERPVEIVEIHIWRLRDGVNVSVEGYVDEGKKIKCFHRFHHNERTVVDDGKSSSAYMDDCEIRTTSEPLESRSSRLPSSVPVETMTSVLDSSSRFRDTIFTAKKRSLIILRPNQPLILPTSDVNIAFGRRNRATYTGWEMVTSAAHAWFNAYFEGGDQYDSGVFECDWDALDGGKGSIRKNTRALEHVKVVWRYPYLPRPEEKEPPKQDGRPEMSHDGLPPGKGIPIPEPGELVPETRPVGG